MIGKNNPLNIRFSKGNPWRGLIGHTKGFCDFASVEYCVRAVAILIMRSYRRAGAYTVEQIIERYAPSSENPTISYLGFVCSQTGFNSAQVPRTAYDVARLIQAMWIFEQGRKIDLFNSVLNVDEIREIIVKHKIKFYYA